MNKRTRNNFKRWITAIIMVAVLFILVTLPSKQTTVNKTANDATSTLGAERAPGTEEYFQNLNLEAKAAYVVDLSTGEIIYAKNENEPLPLASVTKLMMALVSSKILSDNSIVTVTPDSLLLDGDNGLIANEKWHFKDLRNFTLLVSSNDGANAIALASAETAIDSASSTSSLGTTTLESIFVSEMNSEAATLNLPTLHFENESGLDVDATTPGAIGSARDVSSLFKYIIENYPDILDITKYKSFKFTSLSGYTHIVNNTDEDLSKISGIMASKTGYTDLAGGNLVVSYNPDLINPIIIVVLGSSANGRFSDTLALASSTAAYLMRQ